MTRRRLPVACQDDRTRAKLSPTFNAKRRVTRLSPVCAIAAFAPASRSLCVSACSSTPERPATYTVKRGDTLYAIAWRHGLEYRDLARWNDIGRDYVILPGSEAAPVSPIGSRRLEPASKACSRLRRERRPRNLQARPCPGNGRSSGGRATVTARPNGGQGLTITGRRGRRDSLGRFGTRRLHGIGTASATGNWSSSNTTTPT